MVLALGAGFGCGLLVDDGALAADSIDVNEVSSRTAFGIRADGSGFFLVVDKPTGSTGDGITRKKLAQLMLGYGAVKAVNLDGGGSSTLVSRLLGERYTYLLNVPSDGGERVTASPETNPFTSPLNVVRIAATNEPNRFCD